MTATDLLDPAAVLSLLPTLLPSTPIRLSSPQDGIAAMLHTAMSLLGFRLVATDDSAPAMSYPSNVLPADWNKDGPGHYTLRYKHEQSSLEFVMKLTKLGGRTLVNAIAIQSDKTASLDIPTNDFISPSFYPYDASANSPPLVHGFISSNRVTDLMSQFKLQIAQKIIPGLRKDGYSDDPVPASSSASSSDPPRHAPVPPYDPSENSSRYQPHIPPENPLQIGRRDLDPIPMNPHGLFGPPSLFPSSSGDGMFVGPDHPIFDSRRGGNTGERGPWGGDGFLPPMGAPPGARFDPVGPGFGRLGRRGPPGGGNTRGPDNDEFMPPGMGDMFM